MGERSTTKTMQNIKTILQSEHRRYQQSVTTRAENGVLCFPPSEIDRLGMALFSNLESGGVCTLVVGGGSKWNPESLYLKSMRKAARAGLAIERAFLLPHRHYRHDATLKQHVALDQQAGIKTRILYVGDLIADQALPSTRSLDFGIWDDYVGCMNVLGKDGAAARIREWRVTTRRQDLDLLRDTWAVLKQHAPEFKTNQVPSDAPELEEPMLTSAPLAGEVAGVMCKGSYLVGEDCAWYHSIWQYLRVFNMVSTPTWHANFFLREIRQSLSLKDRLRILITGSADYSTLAHVLWAGLQEKKHPTVHVLDICPTPLFLCQWYAGHVDAVIETIQDDIFEFSPEDNYDLITTDAFLTRFDPSLQPTLIRRWSELLTPGGRLVTTVRLDPGAPAEGIVGSDAQAEEFARRALQGATLWEEVLDVDPQQISDAAFIYASRMRSFSVSSVDQLRQMFEEGGFTLEEMTTVEVPGEMVSSVYAEIVAIRA